MNARRSGFYQALSRWWQMAAMDGYDWSQPESPEMLQAEESLWESKTLYENGEIELAEVRPVFETWVKTHQKLRSEENKPLIAMRTHRRMQARA